MPEPGRTLMLSCEDDEDELLRRIDSIRKFHGAEWEDLDDFLPIDLVGEELDPRLTQARDNRADSHVSLP